MDLQPHIEKFATRMGEVETELGDPKVFENNRRAQELGREYARLKNLVALGERLLKAKDELEENRALAAGDDAEMAEMAAEEIPPLEEEIPRLEKEVQFGLGPPDSTDSRNTIVEIRAPGSWKFAPRESQDFQKSEFLLEHGAIDMIVHRSEIRSKIIGILDKISK